MFGLNKDNIVLAALVLALITCFYLFNENKKTKTDIASFKTILNKSPPPPTTATTTTTTQQPKRVKKPLPDPEPEAESED